VRLVVLTVGLLYFRPPMLTSGLLRVAPALAPTLASSLRSCQPHAVVPGVV
jgi:hypothetical protein